ncbi:MAG TPA: signal recognition particle-docking protein FtsY, partial [Candidatus Binataceae bacterium]|nr:signal recognition particle-docking protein FtsY [Candidatus Binataceae bacterium]
PTLELILLLAVAAQLPLFGLAVLLEFSGRKKRRMPEAEAEPEVEVSVERISAAVEAAQQALISEVQPEETRIPPAPTPQAQAPPPPEIPAPFPPSAVEAATGPAKAARVAVPQISPERAPTRIGLRLRKTRENFLARIRGVITGSARVDEICEGLEEALIGADVGVETSLKIVESVRARLDKDSRPDRIREALKDEIERILIATERPLADSGDAPLVIMMAGVNGVGKTTTVAKLAALLKSERGSVIVAAADTFRAAAIDQLQVWCDRVGVDLIKQKQGSDPAAVAFDAVRAAVARKAAVVIIDTAGRLQTKTNLMEELKKIARVVGRELPGAPHETLLVLDATTGQNALSQAKLFGEAVPLTGVVLAKLDSTAKGGVIVGIAERLKLPVRFVGLGEEIADLQAFDPREFVEALFAEDGEGREAASGTYAA